MGDTVGTNLQDSSITVLHLATTIHFPPILFKVSSNYGTRLKSTTLWFASGLDVEDVLQV